MDRWDAGRAVPRPPGLAGPGTNPGERPDNRGMTSSSPTQAQVSGPLVGTKLRPRAPFPGYRERRASQRPARSAARRHDPPDPPLRAAGLRQDGRVSRAGSSRAVSPYAWLSLDAADNDLARFVRYLVARRCGRSGRRRAARSTDLFGPGTNPSPGPGRGHAPRRRWRRATTPSCSSSTTTRSITREPIHRLVRFLIERGPPFVHLVLLTREDPPLPLARLRAHGRLVELRADDLRYTSEEASAYLAEAGVALEPELVERLVERTEGWIAGLQLAAISLRDRSGRRRGSSRPSVAASASSSTTSPTRSSPDRRRPALVPRRRPRSPIASRPGCAGS